MSCSGPWTRARKWQLTENGDDRCAHLRKLESGPQNFPRQVIIINYLLFTSRRHLGYCAPVRHARDK